MEILYIIKILLSFWVISFLLNIYLLVKYEYNISLHEDHFNYLNYEFFKTMLYFVSVIGGPILLMSTIVDMIKSYLTMRKVKNSLQKLIDDTDNEELKNDLKLYIKYL